jgi:hypothetical protein
VILVGNSCTGKYIWGGICGICGMGGVVFLLVSERRERGRGFVALGKVRGRLEVRG